MVKNTYIFGEEDALLIIDVQKDFCKGGALAVPEAEEIIPVINELIQEAEKKGIRIYASRDWHPIEHISFQQPDGQWPPHCIQDTEGAKFHPDLNLPENTIVVTKGVRFDQDQNSAFDKTGLAYQMNQEGIRCIWMGGLALDVCVLQSVLDALKAGFQVKLIKAATRPVDPDKGRQAIEDIAKAGAHII